MDTTDESTSRSFGRTTNDCFVLVLTSPAARGQTPFSGFSGSPIDVDYQAANLRAVLRQLAEVGGLNLVIDPSVPANAVVDLRLTRVPWDQVMEVVLRSS